MASGVKRKDLERDPCSAQGANPFLQDHKRCALLCKSLNKFATWDVLSGENLRQHVLIKNIIWRLGRHGSQPSSQGSGGSVSPSLPQSAALCQDTQSPPASWAPLPGSSAPGGVACPPSAAGNGKAASQAGKGPCTPLVVSTPCQRVAKVAGEGGFPDLLPDARLSTEGQLLHGEGPQPGAGGLESSAMPAAHAAPEQEAFPWEVLSGEELLCNSLLGSLESLRSSYLGSLPVDDPFSDIDTSEFEGTVGASDGQASH